MKPTRKNGSTNYFFILLIGLLPFSFALNLFPDIDLSIVRVIIPLVFLIWILKSLSQKKLFLDTRFRAWLILMIFLLAVLSLSWSENFNKALRKVLFLGSIFPVYWVAFASLRKKIQVDIFLKTIFFTSLLTAFVGLLQFFGQFFWGLENVLALQRSISPFFLGNNFAEVVSQYNSWLVNLNGKTIFRSLAFFPDPHLFSLFLNTSLPISAYLYGTKKQPVFLVGLFVILLSSLLAFSRGGFLSLIMALAFYWIISFRKISIIKNLFFIAALLALLATSNPFSQRLFSSFNFQDGSVGERLRLLEQSWEITKNNLWTGVGIGNLSEKIEPLSDQRIPIYAHNLFLDFSVEIGILGGLALLIIILSPIVTFFKKPTSINLCLAIIFIIILTHSMFETPFYSVRNLPLILSLLAL